MLEVKADVLKQIEQMLDRKFVELDRKNAGVEQKLVALNKKIDENVGAAGVSPDKLETFAMEMHGLVGGLRAELSNLGTQMQSVSDSHTKLLDVTSHGVLRLLPDQVYLRRFWSDHFNEKCEIAKRVAQTYFSRSGSTNSAAHSPTRCFVQASTTAQHLAHHLVTHGHLDPSSLIYTNSVVVPLVLLYGKAQLNIWPFCGPDFDPECGGWLFGSADTRTHEELEKLFKRPEHEQPLTVAFLMPMAITADRGLFYSNPRTVMLAERLGELATQVVIMVPSNRVFTKQADLPGTQALWPISEARWSGLLNKTTLISAGVEHPLPELTKPFADLGIRVEYQDQQTNEWIPVRRS